MPEFMSIPSRAQSGYLDPSIAGEGEKVDYAEGSPLTFQPPPPKPRMPDWSEISSIKKYFGRTGYEPWPAWFYHPTEEARLIKDQREGETIGVYYRKPTADEMARFGVKHGVWDWAAGTQWRPVPYHAPKFDPKKPEHGKEYIDPMRDPGTANRFMVQSLAEAIGKSLQQNGPTAPATVNPNDWAQFQAFLAWKKASEVVGAPELELPVEPLSAAGEEAPEEVIQETAAAGSALEEALSTLSNASELEQFRAQAREKGIKVDGRWSVNRLKDEIANVNG